jgi:hypothetical protein
LVVSDKLNLRNGESQIPNGIKDLFPKLERRVPPLFAWHPDQKLPSFKPQIAHRNKPIERVRIPACSCRKVDTRTALVTDGSYSP